MEASPPELKLLLYRHADTAWREVIQPWFAAAGGRLTRSHVVAPTRGQAYGLKLRCLSENLPLLGVEFLTPGLARQKWLPLHAAENPDTPRQVAGREVLLLGLRILIERRLQPLTSEDPQWGFWKSLQSDPERALDDFDELLKAGFRAEHFGLQPLREIFAELEAWITRLGFALAPKQSEAAALRPIAPDAAQLGGRLLVYGLSAELWFEFSNVAALARRFRDLTIVLPEPEFRGRKQLDEAWIEMWEALLGVSAASVGSPDDVSSRDDVADLWRANASARNPTLPQRAPARVVVGRSRRDEMTLVADEITRALADGADHVGVIFPAADTAHAVLKEALRARRVPFHDAIETMGASTLETQLHRALLAFYQRGARLEELLELWPLLRAAGQVKLTLGVARDVCARLFDDQQTHAALAYAERLRASNRPESREVARILDQLLPPFPAEIRIAQALERFSGVCAAFGLPVPPSFGTLGVLAERESRILPTATLLEALLSFVPEGARMVEPERGNFARVTLLTRRRAEGLSFSHLIFAEANAGVWPRRTESSPWLPDDRKEQINRESRFSLGVFTSEDRATLEKNSYVALARDTRTEVIFSAALFDEAQPEARLAPNSWVERALWADPELRRADCDLAEIFAQLAVSPAASRADAPAQGATEWHGIWRSRRDPTKPFDEFFLSADPRKIRPVALPARLVERAVKDPAELWFDAVLGARRVEWRPFTRARKKAIGQWVHRVLAQALQGEPGEGDFTRRRELGEAQARLRAELNRLRQQWPVNPYWDSFYLELSRACVTLLDAVYAVTNAPFVATELTLPDNAVVPIGEGELLAARGRVDVAWFDRASWENATVDIVDFKTGADAGLSTTRMANSGFALQLGVYLAAAQSLGAAAGRVWMLKPELNGFSSLDMSELGAALAQLRRVGRHLRTGVYGALTPDASDYGPAGFAWPLACVPVPFDILAEKFTRSFADAAEGFAP